MEDTNGIQKVKKLIERIVEENPAAFDSMLDMMAYREDPPSFFLRKAALKFVDEKDFGGAIAYIDKGLEYDSTELKHKLHSLRAECNAELQDDDEFLTDLENAYEYIKESPKYNELFVEFLWLNSDIYLKWNEFGNGSEVWGALEFCTKALEASEEIEDNRSFLRHTLRKRAKIYDIVEQFELAEEDRIKAKEYKNE